MFYQCTSCGAILHPLTGVCCVYCSFGDRQCPSKQREDAKGRKGESPV
ncbi:MAG TPA: GDCCVxC domain-containing (seleno)protein [Anaerolineales bacterium]|nr:GDCCVxC domain-containing (seleno)protein [Anaerolineales bacterium]